jgi:hypothetical protein
MAKAPSSHRWWRVRCTHEAVDIVSIPLIDLREVHRLFLANNTVEIDQGYRNFTERHAPEGRPSFANSARRAAGVQLAHWENHPLAVLLLLVVLAASALAAAAVLLLRCWRPEHPKPTPRDPTFPVFRRRASDRLRPPEFRGVGCSSMSCRRRKAPNDPSALSLHTWT